MRTSLLQILLKIRYAAKRTKRNFTYRICQRYFEKKKPKTTQKRDREKINFARIIFTKIHNYKIKRMILRKNLEYNYYWQNHDNPSNGQCRQLKIYQKYKIKMSKKHLIKCEKNVALR